MRPVWALEPVGLRADMSFVSWDPGGVAGFRLKLGRGRWGGPVKVRIHGPGADYGGVE